MNDSQLLKLAFLYLATEITEYFLKNDLTIRHIVPILDT
jgi:hypothetical protein